MIKNKKSFGSLYDQSESADLDDLQLERSHVRTHFCVDSTNICYIVLLFLLYILLVIIYSFITIRKPDKITRIITRVPVFISGIDSNQAQRASFGIDLKISDLHHNPTFFNYLNCSAVKTSLSFITFDDKDQSQSADFYRSQNVVCENCVKNINLTNNDECIVQFNITEKHKLLDRYSNNGEYSKPTFKSSTFSFSKADIYSSEFNILSFIFNDPKYFLVEQDAKNYIYSYHSKYNTPSISFSFTIDTNYTAFNALDFIYYYFNPIIKKYFSSLTQIFATFIIFALSINIFYAKHKTMFTTRIFCIILGILGFLAANPFENFIDATVFNKLNPNHNLSLNFNSYENKNELSLRIGYFFFALFQNSLRFFVCLQFCFICSHNFKSMFQFPNSLVTLSLACFYIIFTVVDYKAQYNHEKNVFKYSSMSITNRTLLYQEQVLRAKEIYHDPSIEFKYSSIKRAVPPLLIEKVRVYFVLAHVIFTAWLVYVSFGKVNDGADPNPLAENNRLKALVAFSSVPNVASVVVYCLFVPYSVLQRKLFPEVLIFASNELCAAAMLLLFRGVDDDIEDDSFQRLVENGPDNKFS